jgi:hypothetical protein
MKLSRLVSSASATTKWTATLAGVVMLATALSLPAQTSAATPAPAAPAVPAPASAPAPRVVTGRAPAAAPVTARPAGSAAPVTLTPPTAPSTVLPAKGPGGEGMAVHGHWIITVKNADGSVAEKRDFENALLTPTQLLELLAGQAAAGDLAIVATAAGNIPFCSTGGATSSGCTSFLSSSVGMGAFNCQTLGSLCIPSLTDINTNSTGLITLTGTMPVAQSAQITAVYTFLLTCTSPAASGFTTVSATQCYSLTPAAATAGGIVATTTELTGATITALPVTAGQTVLFTVTLTFS